MPEPKPDFKPITRKSADASQLPAGHARDEQIKVNADANAQRIEQAADTSGASTGPHLHYETWYRGARVNPVSAKVPQGTVLAGRELAAFKAEKARIDRLLQEQEQAAQDRVAPEAAPKRLAVANTDPVQTAGLRR